MRTQLNILLLEIKKNIFWIIISFLLTIIGIVVISNSPDMLNNKTLFINLLVGIIDMKKYSAGFMLPFLYDVILVSYILTLCYTYELNTKDNFLVRTDSKKMITSKILVGIIFALMFKLIKILFIFVFFKAIDMSIVLPILIFYIFMVTSLYLVLTIFDIRLTLTYILILYLGLKYYNFCVMFAVNIIFIFLIILFFNSKKYALKDH